MKHLDKVYDNPNCLLYSDYYSKWNKLKVCINQEIYDLCDTAGDNMMKEIVAQQEGMTRILEIMAELEKI